MKHIQRSLIAVFLLMLIVPALALNRDPDAVSETENRKLKEFPELTWSDECFSSLEKYVSDRIGFRDGMVQLYGQLNDSLFHYLAHPLYCYGKNGEIYSRDFAETASDDAHIEAFAYMIRTIETYCEDRQIPFLFVMTPTKSSIVTENLPDGVTVDTHWRDFMWEEFDRLGIHYLDLSSRMAQLQEEGARPYNTKFDSNHWSNYGAYEGVNAILSRMHQDLPSVRPNSAQDFTFGTTVEDHLLVSRFAIHEEVPNIVPRDKSVFTNAASRLSSEIYLDPHNPYFAYLIRSAPDQAPGPRILMIHGSHFTGNTMYYMANAFSEFFAVRNYHNVLHFPYYYNIIKPDCVVLEIAEHVIYRHFNDEEMLALSYNPPLGSLTDPRKELPVSQLRPGDLEIHVGEGLTTIHWKTDRDLQYVWLTDRDTGEEFDFFPEDGGYVTVIQTDTYESIKASLSIVAAEKDSLTEFPLSR